MLLSSYLSVFFFLKLVYDYLRIIIFILNYECIFHVVVWCSLCITSIVFSPRICFLFYSSRCYSSSWNQLFTWINGSLSHLAYGFSCRVCFVMISRKYVTTEWFMLVLHEKCNPFLKFQYIYQLYMTTT